MPYRWQQVFKGSQEFISLVIFLFCGARDGSRAPFLPGRFSALSCIPSLVCPFKWSFWQIDAAWIIRGKRNQLEGILNNLGQRWCDRNLEWVSSNRRRKADRTWVVFFLDFKTTQVCWHLPFLHSCFTGRMAYMWLCLKTWDHRQFTLYYFVCVCVSGHEWRSKDSFGESVLCFHQAGSQTPLPAEPSPQPCLWVSKRWNLSLWDAEHIPHKPGGELSLQQPRGGGAAPQFTQEVKSQPDLSTAAHCWVPESVVSGNQPSQRS